MRDIVKKIWKKIAYIFTRIYLKDKQVFIVNETEKIPQYGKTYSQFGQDAYILNNFFKNIKDGIFVDVGGNKPIEGNNTYLFEEALWKGIAIEPQDELRELWKGVRSTECLGYVIGEENKEISFVEGGNSEHGLSGVEGFNKVSKKNQILIKKEQKRLGDILKENNITKVDYLSIDVEGYEMSVLKSIDFEKVKIKVIDIENNINFQWLPIIGKCLGNELGNNQIRKFLKKKGYKQVARIMCDDIFIKESL